VCIGQAGGVPFASNTAWTFLNNNISTSNFDGSVVAKILNATDISNGFAQVVMTGAYDGVYGMVVFVGPTGGVAAMNPGTTAAIVMQEMPNGVATNNSSGSASITLNSSGAPATSVGIYFAANRATSTNTVNKGTLIGQVSQITGTQLASGALYTDTALPVGSFSTVNSYTVSGSGNYQAIVFVRAIGG
jgi:hypothetical protein